MTYSRKDEHKGRHPFKKGTGQYQRRQQGCATAKGQNVDKKNHSQDYDVGKKNNDQRKQYSQENSEEQHKREGGYPSIGKERWISMRRRQNGIHRREDLYAK